MSLAARMPEPEPLTAESFSQLFAQDTGERQVPDSLSDVLKAVVRTLSERLEELALKPVSVALGGIELLPVREAKDADKEAAFLRFEALAEEEPFWIQLHMGRDLATEFLECALGSSRRTDVDDSARELTETDIALAGFLADQVAGVLSDHLREIEHPELSLNKSAFLPPDQDPRAEPAFSANLKVTFFDRECDLHLLMAADPLEAILVDSAPKPLPQKSDEAWTSQLTKEVQNTQFRLTAHMSAGELPLEFISRLKPGQTIPLEATTTGLVEVKCNAVPFMMCRIGRSGNSFVLAVDRFVNEADSSGANRLASALGVLGEQNEGDDKPNWSPANGR